MLACHNIVEIFIPSKEVEAARDLSRTLDDTRIDLQRDRQRLSKFLLRHGYVFSETNPLGQRKTTWSRDHWKWIDKIKFEGCAHTTYAHYVTPVRCAETDKKMIEHAVKAEALSDRWAAVVKALCTIKGIDVISAFCLAAEAGCFSRFGFAEEYASWCGLIPSEYCSGEKKTTGRITKCGNTPSRRTLTEASWHFISYSVKPKRLPDGWDVAPSISRRGTDCTRRLVKRRSALMKSGHNSCVVNIAVARELACWVWR